VNTTFGGGRRSNEYSGDIRPNKPVTDAKCQTIKKTTIARLPCHTLCRF
jgi:hypothetical protein